MSNPKVVWSEGLFLTPQHFQKSEYYLENFVKSINAEHNLDSLYGFSSLEIDTTLLDLGKFGLKRAKGVFSDGTPFEIDQELIIDIPEGCNHDIIYLALPVYSDGNVIVQYGDNVKTRYKSYDLDVYNNTENNSEQVKIEVADLNFSLKLGSDKLDSYLVLPVAEVSEYVIGNSVVLNQAFIPICTNIAISKYVSENINYIYDKLQYRANLLSRRLSNIGNNKSYQSMIRDYMWMSAISEWVPIWREFAQNKIVSINPKELYFYCISMVGKMYGLDGKVPPELEMWNFKNLYKIFSNVFSLLHECLREVQSDNVTTLEWDTSLFNSRHLLRAMVRDRFLYKDSRFILVVTADCGVTTLINEFPKACKVAGNSEIANIVINALSGVPIRNLSVSPSELKSKNNAAYFEIDTKSPLWQSIIDKDEPIALHLDDRFKDISVDLNIIK
ncbi:MAG: type VI secretion system baseplate subunit TssK [Succinivibrionaceae bacterium]